MSVGDNRGSFIHSHTRTGFLDTFRKLLVAFIH